jgi:pyruvate kinase
MEKENLSEKDIKALAKQVKQNVDSFNAAMERQELNIDKIR